MKNVLFCLALVALMLGCKKQNKLIFANIGGTRYWHGWERDLYMDMNGIMDSEVRYNVYDTFYIRIINDTEIYIGKINLGAGGHTPQVRYLVPDPSSDSLNKVAFYGNVNGYNYQMSVMYDYVKNSIYIDCGEGYLTGSPSLGFALYTP